MRISIRTDHPSDANLTALERENDALTWAELREQGYHTARITCRVCGLPSTVTALHVALLCQPCLVDLLATRQHVEYCLSSVEQRWNASITAFDHRIEISDPETRERWEMVGRARGTPLFAQAWQARRGEETSFGELLRAYEDVERLSDELERWRAALLEVEIAEEGPDGMRSRYLARRASMTTEDGMRPYGWWMRYQKDYRADATMTQAEIERDAARLTDTRAPTGAREGRDANAA